MMDTASLGFIDDDYTLPGYIAQSQASATGRRYWDAMEFTYRVATRAETKLLDAKVAKAERDAYHNPEAAVKADLLACEFIAAHVKEWDLKNRGGHDVPRTAANIQRLHPSLFERLYLMIRGDVLSDLKPGQDDAPVEHDEQTKN